MSTYQLSPYVRTVFDKETGDGLVYHALYGNPLILNDEGFKLLSLFKEPVSPYDITEHCEGDPGELVGELTRLYFLVEPGFDERKFLRERKAQHLSQVRVGQTIDRMSLAISDSCNFGCTHCIQFQPLTNNGKVLPIYQKPAKQLHMSWETAKTCIEHYLALMRQSGHRVGRVHFGNAEPLLNWPVIQQVLDYCSGIEDIEFDFTINTNLVLMDRNIAEAFKRHRVSISTSLDGTSEANNAIRITKGGKGTYDTIIAKFDLLAEVGYPLEGFSVTVAAGNYELVDTEIVDLAADRGMTYIAFDYDLIGLLDVPLEDKVAKLVRIKKYANVRGIDFMGTWDTPFRHLTTASLLDEDYAFCAAVQGKSLSFNVDGSIKTCGYTTTQVGHIDHFDEMFQPDGGLFRMVQERFPGTSDFCSGCEIEGPCGGQCHVTREVVSRSTGEHRQKLFGDMCDFYRAVTQALAIEYIKSGGDTDLVSHQSCSM